MSALCEQLKQDMHHKPLSNADERMPDRLLEAASLSMQHQPESRAGDQSCAA